jgi:hypothetical protein
LARRETRRACGGGFGSKTEARAWLDRKVPEVEALRVGDPRSYAYLGERVEAAEATALPSA